MNGRPIRPGDFIAETGPGGGVYGRVIYVEEGALLYRALPECGCTNKAGRYVLWADGVECQVLVGGDVVPLLPHFPVLSREALYQVARLAAIRSEIGYASGAATDREGKLLDRAGDHIWEAMSALSDLSLHALSGVRASHRLRDAVEADQDDDVGETEDGDERMRFKLEAGQPVPQLPAEIEDPELLTLADTAEQTGINTATLRAMWTAQWGRYVDNPRQGEARGEGVRP